MKGVSGFESFTKLCNAPLSGSTDLFPQDAVERAMENSSHVLHDEAIRKVVTMEKGQKKCAKKLQFYLSA